MSPPPTSDFNKLSLAAMPPTTRAQAQSSSQLEEHDDTTGGLDEDDDDNRSLVVDKCISTGDYIAVQMSQPAHYSIRIGPPGSSYERPLCSCAERQPCSHLSWLLERIADRTIQPGSRAATLKLWMDGAAADAPDPYLHISNIGVNVLEAALQRPDRSATSLRWKEVRDILGFLSPVASDRYRPDIFERPPQDLTVQAAVAEQDLEAIVAATLMTNDVFFNSLRRTVPPSACDADFFIKKATEAQSNVDSLNDYVTTRAVEGDTLPRDIPWCAASLTAIVAAIRKRVMDPYLQALTLQDKEEAARSLIAVLSLVTAHNTDVYTNPIWGLEQQRLLPLHQRNLFNALIGSWSSGKPRFVIDELEELADVLPPFVSSLENITDELRAHRTPLRYVDRLGALIKRLKRTDVPGASEASGSGAGGKRRGGGGKEGGELKRMRGAK